MVHTPTTSTSATTSTTTSARTNPGLSAGASPGLSASASPGLSAGASPGLSASASPGLFVPPPQLLYYIDASAPSPIREALVEVCIHSSPHRTITLILTPT